MSLFCGAHPPSWGLPGLSVSGPRVGGDAVFKPYSHIAMSVASCLYGLFDCVILQGVDLPLALRFVVP